MSLDDICEASRKAAQDGDWEKAWRLVRAHWPDVTADAALAWHWLMLVHHGETGLDQRAEVETILDAYASDPFMTELGTNILRELVDGRAGDEPIPEDDPAIVAARKLRRCMQTLGDDERLQDPECGGQLWLTLANCLRLSGPNYDTEAAVAFEHALALAPDEPWRWFDFALFHKLRGRFVHALEIFLRVDAQTDEDDSATLNNIAVCATAAGDVDNAEAAWKRLGFDVTRGDDGLPAASIGDVKVRLSTGGIGDRHPGAGPVQFEHVWVRTLSPCHGVVLNPPMYPVHVALGDVVLFDRAPVGFAEHDGHQVPRLPFLKTLREGGTRSFAFRAQQSRAGAVADASDQLPGEASLYVFDESIQHVCEECIRGDAHSQADAHASLPDASVVSGVLVVPKETPLADVARAINLLDEDAVRVLCIPEFRREVGDSLGERRDRERWDALAARHAH